MDFTEPPFCYTGSKFKLLSQIIPNLDFSKKNFIDLFLGGGAILYNVIDKYDYLLGNDIICDLMDIHKQLMYNSEKFVENVRKNCPEKNNQEGYIKLRESYNLNASSDKLFALMLCCTNNFLRFNKSFKFNQTFGKRSFSKKTQSKIDNFIKHLNKFDKNKLNFQSEEFFNIKLENCKNYMYYIDPPYYSSEAGYNAYWSLNHENKLYDYIININNCGGSFCLSGISGMHKNNQESLVITKLRNDGFKFINIEHDYKKVARNKDEIRGQEILIVNY